MCDSRPDQRSTMTLASHAAVLQQPFILAVAGRLPGSCTAVAVFLSPLWFFPSLQFLLPLLSTLCSVVTHGKENKKKENPSESLPSPGRLRFDSMYFLFCCRLPGEQMWEGAGACLFASGRRTSSVPRLWCGPARG